MWRVRNWDAIYENNRSRVIDNTTWVPMPNKHDSNGYLQLMDHNHGAMHYGAWCALVQVASKCKPRGTLVRDGKAHSVDSLARQTRIGSHVFSEAIPRFLSVEIEWLEEVDESNLTPGCRSPDARVLSTLSTNGTNERTEGNERKERIPVRSLGAIDQTCVWEEARKRAREIKRALWPSRVSPLSDRDRDMLLKVAYLSIATLSKAWLSDGVEGTRLKDAKKPAAYLKTVLAETARKRGHDLNGLLDTIEIPPPPATDKKTETEGKELVRLLAETNEIGWSPKRPG